MHTGNIVESEFTAHTHTEKRESRMAFWCLAWVAKQRDSIHRDWGSIRKAKTEEELTAR